ncbi:unnamed protein product, partial [Didymodactylos carnosus]
KVPLDGIEEIDFSITLSELGITDIHEYYNSMNTMDTGNATFLTTQAYAFLNNDPYRKHIPKIDKNLLKTPKEKRCWKFDDSKQKKTCAADKDENNCKF